MKGWFAFLFGYVWFREVGCLFRSFGFGFVLACFLKLKIHILTSFLLLLPYYTVKPKPET